MWVSLESLVACLLVTAMAQKAGCGTRLYNTKLFLSPHKSVLVCLKHGLGVAEVGFKRLVIFFPASASQVLEFQVQAPHLALFL